MDNKEITINSKQVFKGKVLTLNVDDVKCFNGNISNREIIKHPGGVCILAFDENNKILIEKQYRYAFDEVLYELPAGKLEYNEDSKEAGIRELQEETGYIAKDLISMGKMYPTCGYSNEIIHLYLANNLTKGNTNFDEDESIELLHLSLEEIIQLINDNKIVDGKTITLIGKYLMYDRSKN